MASRNASKFLDLAKEPHPKNDKYSRSSGVLLLEEQRMSRQVEERSVAKGEVVKTGEAILVVPLFTETDDDLLELPGFEATEHRLYLLSDNDIFPKNVKQYISNVLNKANSTTSSPDLWVSTVLVVMALHVWFHPQVRDTFLPEAPSKLDTIDEDSRQNLKLALRTWRILHKNMCLSVNSNEDGQMKGKRCSEEAWIHLVQAVAQRLALIQVAHPVYEYAQTVLPQMARDGEKLKQCAKILQIQQSSESSILLMMKHAQDQSPPRTWAVLMTENFASALIQECFPTADLVLVGTPASTESTKSNSAATVHVVANYNQLNTSLGVWGVDLWQCRQDESLEDRVRKIKAALQPTCCVCDRCRYEMMIGSGNAAKTCIADCSRLLRLAHGYMACGDFDQAKSLYQHIIRGTSDNLSAEAWHALGALELSQGRFLAAQQIWNEARQKLTTSTNHAGLRLQWTKLDAYQYFGSNSKAITASFGLPGFSEVAPQAFVVPSVNADICDQIFAWAQTGTWTRQRHYAVPTCDVPIHTVPPLLAWFNEFMSFKMCSLLGHLFKTSPNYYVHDAFVVQYNAGQSSNHLPIHTDESSHSFVLALNGPRDYKGGGTYFYDTNQVFRIEKGHILCFRGDLVLHGGEAVSEGTRLIIAAFLYHDDNIASKYSSPECGKKEKRACPQNNEKNATKLAKHSTFAFDFQISG